MIGHQFYPTPPAVLDRMFQAYRGVGWDKPLFRYGDRPKRVLEPSAGRGDILDYIRENTEHPENITMHACEIDGDLNATLSGKGYAVVGWDFLQYRTEVPYDLIVMNPPFDDAVDHILHAFSMLDGELIALCNAETVRNPRGEKTAHLLKLIKQHGKIKYIGRAFKGSDRTTDVEVAMVTLSRNAAGAGADWWDPAKLHVEINGFDAEGLADDAGLVRHDAVDAMVNSYAAARSVFRDYLVAHIRLKNTMSHLRHREGSKPDELAFKQAGTYWAGAKDDADKAQQWAARADLQFAKYMQEASWFTLMEGSRFRAFATEQVQKQIGQLLAQQQGMPFTSANINALLAMFFENRGELMRRCLVEAFDKLCDLTPDNTSHWEGWKTNDAHKVNRRIVVPYMGFRYDPQFDWFSESRYGDTGGITDIDRALALLEGRTLDDQCRVPHLQRRGSQNEVTNTLVTIKTAIRDAIHNLPKPISSYHWNTVDNTCESEYFHIRFWKKGTAHLFFKDEGLWRRFNMAAAEGRNWLPRDKSAAEADLKTKPTDRKIIRDMDEAAQVKHKARLQC